MKTFPGPTAVLQGTTKSRSPALRELLLWNIVPRGLALFLGGFGLLNIIGGLRHRGFDANLWWIDLRFVPNALATALLLAASLALFAFGIAPPRSAWRRWATIILSGALVAVSLANTITFYNLLLRGNISSRLPVPLSLFPAAGLGLILTALLRRSSLETQPARLIPALTVCLVCVSTFPLAEMLCFGETDYHRPADIAVVLGARVYADGRLSDALADRVRTACRLYQAGLTKKLICSGGAGDGSVSEPEAMRRMAIQLGVKSEDIMLDNAGLNTQATVKNSLPVFRTQRASRILVVSHFYHLPRIKLAYQREGLEVYTVPAKESYLLGQMPFNMAREVAALWVYYLRPLRSAV